MNRIFVASVASVYPQYVAKVEKKGRSKSELHRVVEWLTGFARRACNTTCQPVRRSSSSSPQPN